MHIVLGLITAIAGLVWALYRLQNSGVDLNAFNPFYWVRRRNWEKQLGTRPLHRLHKPVEAAALLVVATAKLDGDITREQKSLVLQLFTQEFRLTESAAKAHYAASVHLLEGVTNIVGEVPHILAPTKGEFQPAQVQSLLRMMNAVAEAEGGITAKQRELADAVRECLVEKASDNGTW